MEDFFTTIQERRSVRKFKQEPIPSSVIEKIIAAGALAPSAGNVQPWKFYVVRQPEHKRSLAAAAWGQKFVAEAPVVIVVVAETAQCAAKYGSRGSELYAVQDTAAATENILLSAFALGLGGCWVGAFDEGQIRQILGLSQTQRPLAIIPLGYPADAPRTRQLKSTSEVTVAFD